MNTYPTSKKVEVIYKSKDNPKDLIKSVVTEVEARQIKQGLTNRQPFYIGKSLVDPNRFVDMTEVADNKMLQLSGGDDYSTKAGCPKCDRGWVEGVDGFKPCTCASDAARVVYNEYYEQSKHMHHVVQKKAEKVPYVSPQGHPTFWKEVLEFNKKCEARGMRWLRALEINDVLKVNRSLSAREVFKKLHNLG